MQGSKLHKGLVVKPRLLTVELLVGKARKKRLAFFIINRCIDIEKTRQHAIDVAIHHGVGQIKGDGSDGGSGIVANAFEAFKFLKISGKLSTIFRYHLLCTMVQITRSRIIA